MAEKFVYIPKKTKDEDDHIMEQISMYLCMSKLDGGRTTVFYKLKADINDKRDSYLNKRVLVTGIKKNKDTYTLTGVKQYRTNEDLFSNLKFVDGPRWMESSRFPDAMYQTTRLYELDLFVTVSD